MWSSVAPLFVMVLAVLCAAAALDGAVVAAVALALLLAALGARTVSEAASAMAIATRALAKAPREPEEGEHQR